MSDKPFFSIIVTSLNAESSIGKTIGSIIEQTFDSYEIIVKDGKSSDDTLANIPKNDKIRIFSMEDKGIYDGMNQACQFIRGEYILFLNCGDIFFDRDVLKEVYFFLNKTICSDVILYGQIYNDSRKCFVLQDESVDTYFWYRTTLCHQSVFFPKKALINCSPYNTNYKIAADFDLLFRLYRFGYKFNYINRAVSIYEGNGISASKNGRLINKKEKKQILKTQIHLNQRILFFIRKCLNKVFRSK